MAFEYKAEVPSTDGGTETVVLVFKDIDELPMGVLIDNRDNLTGEVWDTLLWGLSDQLDVLRRVPKKHLRPMLDAWQEFGDITVGESAASSASSTDTVKPSRPTSSETGSD